MLPMRLLYPPCRALLFMLDPETAHAITFAMLKLADCFKLSFLYRSSAKGKPVDAMGLTFPNGVGLAAGLDKDGAYLDAMAPLGFGFIEVGTVTPRPQPGNLAPRMFRIPLDKAIINRMGFNNAGVDAMVEKIRRSRYYRDGGVIGINIGKNFDTPIDSAVDDYLLCLEKAYPVASYIAVNISSPNTPNLRRLQGDDFLDELLAALKQKQTELQKRHGRYVPIAVKIAPDLTDAEIESIADKLVFHRMDGAIATNTTVSREGLTDQRLTDETGGLSGKPLRARSNWVLSVLAKRLANRLPIIAVGGINSGDDALEKNRLGATLVQLYSGFIFEGPALVGECVESLASP